MKRLAQTWYRLPPFVRGWLARLSSLALGAGAAVLFHYALYRFTLPSKPFIYVAF